MNFILVILKMIKKMDMEELIVDNLNTKGIIKIIKNMEKESVFGKMVLDVRLFFIKVILKGKFFIILLMGRFIKE